jgi:formamidopyrimidine-DNA glycosylase
MPELAEVEFFRRVWDPGLGRRVRAVELHPEARIFRFTDPTELVACLTGARLLASEARGKLLGFRVSGGARLGIHLGMSGRLDLESASFEPGRHDHLVLRLRGRALVFSDPRLFGRVLFAREEAPPWWSALPPEVLSPDFTPEAVAAFLRRRARSPIKAVLLMQERFPGIGNWMADEILWRSGIHPRTPAGAIGEGDARRLWRETRAVARGALRSVAPVAGGAPRSDAPEHGDPPRGWLFHVRWGGDGRCPRTGVPLVRERIGGRTTCWSPGRQRLSRRGEKPAGSRRSRAASRG